MRKQRLLHWQLLIVYLKSYSLLLTFTQVNSQNVTSPARNNITYSNQTQTTSRIPDASSLPDNSSISSSTSTKLALTPQFTHLQPLTKSPSESSTAVSTGSKSSATYESTTRSTRAVSDLELLTSRTSTILVNSTPSQSSDSTVGFSDNLTPESLLPTEQSHTPSLSPTKGSDVTVRTSTSTPDASATTRNKTSPITSHVSSDILGHLTSQEPDRTQSVVISSPRLTQTAPSYSFSTTQKSENLLSTSKSTTQRSEHLHSTGKSTTQIGGTSHSTRELELPASSTSTEPYAVQKTDSQSAEPENALSSTIPTPNKTETSSLQASTTDEAIMKYDANVTTVTGRFNITQSVSEQHERFGTCRIVMVLLVVIGVALTVGGIIFVGKQCYEKWGKGDYSQLDFLVNGMYY